MDSIVPANRRSQDGESETSWRNLLLIRQAVKGPEVHATTPVVHATLCPIAEQAGGPRPALKSGARRRNFPTRLCSVRTSQPDVTLSEGVHVDWILYDDGIPGRRGAPTFGSQNTLEMPGLPESPRPTQCGKRVLKECHANSAL
jgi:hypothetical protein